ncbi:MAG: hypothetical protein KIS66_00130 [Fimbriimonadaceae bacterium]|nr:hypothetical protein [Fimbriimonadaceae bacterium]
MPKPKIGFYWCASCGGCEESIVDVAEAILEIAELVDFAIWPVAMDFKRADVEALEDGAITATMINGAIRTSEQEEMARLLRRKSQVLIAYGSCAHTGGIPGLANQFSREAVMRYVYHDCPTVVNPQGTEPQTEYHDEGRVATLPEFRDVVRSLDQVVDVDYYMPGCAPNPTLVLAAIRTLLSGVLPPKGSVLAPDIALCDTCPRIDTKPVDLEVATFKRTHLHKVDPDVCLLTQGFLCLGPATRSGCGERCIRGNMPCTGCFGPLSNVHDHGAKMLSAMTSILAAEEEDDIDKALEGIPDPVGSFYRYGLPVSMLRRKVDLPFGHRN